MDTTLILAITVVIILLLIILFSAVYINSKRINSSKVAEIRNKLEELSLSIQSVEDAIRRDGVVKLDNLLSKVLQLRYNNTLPCGENLKKTKDLFEKKEYNELWNAHKIRNNIVHNDYEISSTEAASVYKIYKSSINKLLK